MKEFSRRSFLTVSAAAACALVVSTGLEASDRHPNYRYKHRHPSISFEHGVASGDPLHDKVIIWTRITPNKPKRRIHLFYEVATDSDFNHITHRGRTITHKDQDYTVKIDLHNLQADQVYYYRFFAHGLFSPIGKTKTLPLSNPESVTLAVLSCANYPKGYFNVYKEASTFDQLDVVVHLGDYIYEYGMFDAQGTPEYATEDALAIGRELPAGSDTECLTLDDYRNRYALYRTDEGLQALHAKQPFILVWDDHEIANDAFKDGAANHDPLTEGDYNERRDAAMKAYFEWLPIRPVAAENYSEIYRSFDFGSLVSLHMLDTRHTGREKQLSYNNYFQVDPQTGALGLDAVRFTTDLTTPSRTLLGTDQLQWLQTQMASSNATWQVLGQQVLMGRMNLPAELLILIAQLDSGDPTVEAAAAAALNIAFAELGTIKYRMLVGDPSLTETEKARVTTVLPYNLDAWDGYFYERETVLNTAVALNKNLVVLSGDTHNAWASDLKTLNGVQAGVEFATAAVSSPGIEEYLRLTAQEAHSFEQLLTLLIDTLAYTNQNDRGFMTITFTQEEARTTWHYVDNSDSTTYEMLPFRQKSLAVKAGSSERSIIESL
ncbi:MAG: alkaline phosphatase D family protein [Thiovulaceae bacterium]|nr:alkaline phosphatase D family protein [Sulfurimonadaceae bacterium]